MDQTQQLLQQSFKLENFRLGQRQVIDILLAGRSALAVFPTGGGKSLCYQLPALQMEGLTLVVSPLIALMKDQVDQLNRLGIAAARLDSTLDAAAVNAVFTGLNNGSIKLLYVAPERLTNERFVARLQRVPLAMMAVDEAHCISEWGHNFRPDYLKLAQTVQTLKVPRVLALTATATPEVSREICQRFGIMTNDHVQTGFYRANLAIRIQPQVQAHRADRLLQGLKELQENPDLQGASIVYVTLQKTAEQLAQFLTENGLRAQAYHAGLKDDLRHQVQDAFMGGDSQVVVATIAFGMGIDKADIRAVYHYNLPKSLENYMQEIGRAGRDGHPSLCTMLANTDDRIVLENFTYGDTPEPHSVQAIIQFLLEQQQEFDVSFYEMSYQYDVRPLVLSTLFTYLELEGIIVATSPFYSEYKLQFMTSRDQLISGFDARRQAFLNVVFDSGKSGRTWLTLEPRKAAETLGLERDRIIRALSYLEEKGGISLKVAGVRQGYRIVKRPQNTEALMQRMGQLFAQREARDIGRLQTAISWIQTTDCHQQGLVAYFGEQLEQPCGQCSACLNQAVNLLPEQEAQQVDFAVIEQMQAAHQQSLSTPRQQARFLCGISSPKASRAKLGRHGLFGALATIPFKQVLEACERTGYV